MIPTTAVEESLPETLPYYPLRYTGRFAPRNDVTTADPLAGIYNRTTDPRPWFFQPLRPGHWGVSDDAAPMSYDEAVAAGKRLAKAFRRG